MKKFSWRDVPAQPVDMPGAKGVAIQWLIDKETGAENFWMRRFEVEPGGCTPLHRHDFEHEVFVLSGCGVVVNEGQEHELKAGDVVFMPPGEEHQFRCAGDEPLAFLCLVPAD